MRPFILQIACFFVFLTLPITAVCQIYSVNSARKTAKPLSIKIKKNPGPFEFSTGVFARSLRFTDPKKYSVSDGETGSSARLLYYPANWLALGAEYAYARALPSGAFLKKQEDERTGVYAKWMLSPDTTPGTYLFIGGGNATIKTQAVLDRVYRANGFYAYGGIGMAWALGEAWRIEAEYALGYTDVKQINALVTKDSPVEQSLQVRLAWRL